MNYRTYADMALHTNQILPKISDVDLIVGIPRSGMVPAYMIGAFLNRYVCSLDEFVSGIAYSKGIRSVRERTVKKVLVVDDSVNDGLAMRRAKKRLQGKEKEFELVYMAVYAVEKATGLVDVYADICPQPRFFQWNYMYIRVCCRKRVWTLTVFYVLTRRRKKTMTERNTVSLF